MFQWVFRSSNLSHLHTCNTIYFDLIFELANKKKEEKKTWYGLTNLVFSNRRIKRLLWNYVKFQNFESVESPEHYVRSIRDNNIEQEKKKACYFSLLRKSKREWWREEGLEREICTQFIKAVRGVQSLGHDNNDTDCFTPAVAQHTIVCIDQNDKMTFKYLCKVELQCK